MLESPNWCVRVVMAVSIGALLLALDVLNFAEKTINQELQTIEARCRALEFCRWVDVDMEKPRRLLDELLESRRA